MKILKRFAQLLFIQVENFLQSEQIQNKLLYVNTQIFAKQSKTIFLIIINFIFSLAYKKNCVLKNPEVLLIRPKQHRGSVYCCGFNPSGELLATGSNDKTIRLMGFNSDECKIGNYKSFYVFI